MTTPSLQKLDERVKAMVGKSFLVNAITHKVVSYRIENDRLTIISDKKWFPAVDVQHSGRLLETFLETDDEEQETLPATPVQSEILSAVPDLKAIMLDNIKKVQQDKGYIPQANAIAKQINTMINMVNAEIAFSKAKAKS